jgi:hypothetical protein
MFKKLLAACALSLLSSVACAQTAFNGDIRGVGPFNGVLGPISTTATISGFAPNGNYATLTATGSSASSALPSASGVVVFQNLGTTTVSCTLGIGSATATANQIVISAGQSIALTVGINTFGACIDQTGSASNVVNLIGGSGIYSGVGGGGGSSGGGGAVTIADGADTTQGTTTDAACGTDNGTCTDTALMKRTNQRLTSAITALGSPFQAGGSIANTAFTANAGTNLNTSALALDASVATTNTDLGPPGATACATDTGSCSLNALEQRIAQRITSMITALGSPFQAGGSIGNSAFTVNAGANLNTSALALESTQMSILSAIQNPIAGVSATQTGAAAASLSVSGSHSISSISGSAAASSYIMVFNATAAPSDGAVTPLKCWGPMSAAGPFSFGWGPGPLFGPLGTGITVVSSSTGCFTKTATNAAFLALEYQ